MTNNPFFKLAVLLFSSRVFESPWRAAFPEMAQPEVALPELLAKLARSFQNEMKKKVWTVSEIHFLVVCLVLHCCSFEFDSKFALDPQVPALMFKLDAALSSVPETQVEEIEVQLEKTLFEMVCCRFFLLFLPYLFALFSSFCVVYPQVLPQCRSLLLRQLLAKILVHVKLFADLPPDLPPFIFLQQVYQRGKSSRLDRAFSTFCELLAGKESAGAKLAALEWSLVHHSCLPTVT